MAFLEPDELYDVYTESRDEAHQWRKDYKEYERLADNDLLEDLDESLPEVNDGSLAAALYKLPKRIVSSKLTGRAKAVDSDDAWITELANFQWEDNIVPNANEQAPFHRKWKDAVRKAAIYGSQPIITLFLERGNYTGADFIVPAATDVTLEVGKVSDYDSDVIFWDVYYSDLQARNMLEQALKESGMKIVVDKDGVKTVVRDKDIPDEDIDEYNIWNIEDFQAIIDAKMEEERESQDAHNQTEGKSVKKGGIKFCIVFQRGIDAPFYMYHQGTKKVIREWKNPDPTGDLPVHYLYCYQDFINPYGTGIVKLAGGTQNVLDYMRQADILATQLGLEPPIDIKGDADSADLDSLVYARRAQWFSGNADIKPIEMSNSVYQQLPERIGMYKNSLNQLLPMGDTSISAASGDPMASKTPAGVKFAAANLSIDDDDFKDNLYITYEAVAKSMINTHFANMQGTDLMKLSDEERDILMKSGIEFPTDEEGNPTNELEILWDEARATFDFEIEAEQDKAKDEEKRLAGLMQVMELKAADPNFDMDLQADGKRLNKGELLAEAISLMTDNDKIIEDIDPEDMEMGVDPMTGQPMAPEQMPVEGEMPQEQMPMEQPMPEQEMPMEAPLPEEGQDLDPEREEFATNLAAVMEQYGVDEEAAMFALKMERSGDYEDDDIKLFLERQAEVSNV